jgi:hypothetical protein
MPREGEVLILNRWDVFVNAVRREDACANC